MLLRATIGCEQMQQTACLQPGVYLFASWASYEVDTDRDWDNA